MYVIEVFDQSTQQPVKYYKLIGTTYSPCVTDTVNEANGWVRVRMSVPEWEAHEQQIMANLGNTKKFWIA